MARLLEPGRRTGSRARDHLARGFEKYFEEIAPLLPPNRPEPDFAALAEVRARYDLEMDPDSIGPLMERHGLTA